MNDKEIIKDLASIIRDVLVNRTDIGYIPDLAFPVAKEVLKHYQLKFPENSIVISKEEYKEYKEFKSFMERNDWEGVKHMENTLDKCQEVLYERLQQERKKIAENYKTSMMLSIQEMQKYLEIDEEQAKLLYYHNAQIAKQFGVGAKE